MIILGSTGKPEYEKLRGSMFLQIVNIKIKHVAIHTNEAKVRLRVSKNSLGLCYKVVKLFKPLFELKKFG